MSDDITSDAIINYVSMLLIAISQIVKVINIIHILTHDQFPCGEIIYDTSWF